MSNNTTVFKELPKEQRKALQKEFYRTPEAKKFSKIIIIIAFIFSAFTTSAAIAGTLLNHTFYYFTPIFFIVILPAIISQQKFEKWLMTEKNVIMKRKSNTN